MLIYYKKDEKKFVKYAFDTGGMPSSHTASVAALTTIIGLMQGFSSLFFVCLVFSLIVFTDAFRMRESVGEQAKTLNKLLSKMKIKDKVEIVLGHTFLQALAGVIIGFAVALIIFYV
jgi:acid phosphatase family membrane protein YuiD